MGATIRFAFLAALTATALAQAPSALVATNLPEILNGNVSVNSTSAVIPVPVSGCKSIRFQAIAPVSGVAMALRNPSNVDAASIALGNVSFASGADISPNNPLPGGVFTSASINAPVDGAWSAVFTFPPASAATVIQFTHYCESEYAAGLAIERTQFVTGEDIGIGMLILKGQAPVLGLTPTLSVRRLPSGTLANVPLADNGLNPDAASGDGIYTGDFVWPQAGKYEITGSVTIPTPNGPVTRTVKQRVHVADAGLSATNVTTQTVSSGGCVTGMQVQIAVNVLTPGSYLTRVVLQASNGKQVSATAASTFAASGSATSSVQFPLELLRDLGVDGPYLLQQVRIDQVQNEQFTLAFLRQPAGQTVGVTLNQLCANPIEIAGPVVATPTLSSGFISSLSLSFGVKATIGGNYNVSYKVLGSRGEDLGLYVQSRSIPAGGVSTFTQPIDSFALLNADGPYAVVSVLVSGPQSAQFSNIGSTQGFSRWQFLPRTAGDLDGDGDVDAADRGLQATFRNEAALSPGDRRDLNRDGKIDILDLRKIQALTCAVGLCPVFAP